MANVCVSVSPGLKKEMDGFRIVNWSEVARQAFQRQVEELKQLQAITRKSKATRTDVIAISKKVKRGIWGRHEAGPT